MPINVANMNSVRHMPVANSRRIVLTTFGSLGDLHPYIAVALGLKGRGHDVILATSEFYRAKIQALGIGFHPVRPDMPDFEANPGLAAHLMDMRKGTERILLELVFPALRDSYDDLLVAAKTADLIVSHALTYTVPLIVEKTGIPWVSTMLAPLGFFSVYDPPALAPAPFFSKLRFLGPILYRPLFGLLKWTVRSWCEPLRRLRADLGLPPSPLHPLIEGMFAPGLVLAFFSELLAAKQRDWPGQTRITGFAFYDQDGAAGMSPELVHFLDNGPPPIVFTLGSTAVMDAGTFYHHSAEAAKILGRRAILLVGKDARNRPGNLPEGIATFDYAPFSELFPRAAAIVHQGGVGTTGQAMRSGRPMLVMPYAHDQPDNAERVTRLGIARNIRRRDYTPTRVAKELRILLDDPAYARKAVEVGKRIAAEDGVRVACNLLEEFLNAEV
jgi:UDP:flavonoid glycosyltransferase YjiC (YdhE family)